jgi:hypothetical protein
VAANALQGSPAQAGDEPWGSAVVELASSDGARRAAAATGLGREGGEGARLAMVLAELAVRDPDPKVREAASGALQSVATRGLSAYAEHLRKLQAARDTKFLQWTETVIGRSDVWRFAADALAHPKATEADRDLAMGALPIMFAVREPGPKDGLRGLDLLLVDEAVRGAPGRRALALAALALLGCACARDAGLAPPTTPQGGADGIAALIGMLKDPSSPFACLAQAILGAAAPATPDVLKAVTGAFAAVLPPPGQGGAPLDFAASLRREIGLGAVRRLGRAAAAAEADVRKALALGDPGATRTLVRLGVRKDLTPMPSETTAARAIRDLDAGADDTAYIRHYLSSVEEVAWEDAQLARPFAVYLTGLAWTAVDQPGYGRGSEHIWQEALYIRALLGPIHAGDETTHVEFFMRSKSPDLRFAGGLLKAALGMQGGVALPAPGMPPLSHHSGARLLAARRVARDGALPASFLREQPGGSPAVVGALEGLSESPSAAASHVEGLLHVLSWAQGATEPMRSSRVASVMEDIEVVDRRIRVKVVEAALARALAVRALGAAGPAAAKALAQLEPLRTDPDPMLRWHVERARHAIQAR